MRLSSAVISGLYREPWPRQHDSPHQQQKWALVGGAVQNFIEKFYGAGRVREQDQPGMVNGRKQHACGNAVEVNGAYCTPKQADNKSRPGIQPGPPFRLENLLHW